MKAGKNAITKTEPQEPWAKARAACTARPVCAGFFGYCLPAGGGLPAALLAGLLVCLLAGCGTTGSAAARASGPNGGSPPPASAGSWGRSSPGWLSDLESDFPSAQYLAAVGSGDSRRGAEDDAAGALARLFTVNVKVDALSQKRYAELVKSDTTYTESEIAISQTVGTQANEQFVNLRFSDPYTDERGVTHVVAYLEREPTAAIYRTLIQKDLAKIEDFKSRGGARKEVLQRYAFYDAARSVGLNAERLIAQLRIIHPAAARLMEAQFDMTHVNEAIDREAAKMTYLVAITGDNDGRIGGLVRKCMDSLSLSFHQRGPLMVKGSWNIEPVTLNPQFKSVRWTADFSLYDEAGRAIATFVKQTRENAISDAEARGFAYREAEKAISRDFAGSIRAYLTRVVTGG